MATYELKISANGTFHLKSSWVPHEFETWYLIKIYKEKYFHWSKFHDNLKESKVQGGGLLQWKRFWNSSDTTLTSTLVCNKYIREFTSLDSTTSIKSKLVPPLVRVDFIIYNPAYFHLTRILRDHLLKCNIISSVLAPILYNTLTC